MRDNIRIAGDTIIKTGDPDLMRVEVEKTTRAFEIGHQSGLFRVPRILDYDEKKGEVVFERIVDIHGVRHAVSFGSRSAELLGRIGVALALVHRELELPGDMVIALPDEFALKGNEVFLHGDFSVDNVCTRKGSSEIVILDWQMTKVHGGKATYGTRYFDVVWFINNLFTKPFHKYLSGSSVGCAAKKFLFSYLGACDVQFSVMEFASYMRQFYRTKLVLRSKSLTWKRRLLLVPGHAFWRMFIESISSNNERIN